MFAIYAIQQQPESTDYSLVALFTTEPNAYRFMAKIKEKFPDDDFEVTEWWQPVVDPIELNEVFPS